MGSNSAMGNGTKENYTKGKLYNLFEQETVENIKSMFWAKSLLDDKFIWGGSKTGSFTVISAYKLEDNEAEVEDAWWKLLWKSRLHERSKVFMWKLANFGLPVKSNLFRRGIDVENDRCVHGYPDEVLPVLPNDKESFFLFSVTILENLWGLQNKTLRNEPIGSIDIPVLKIWDRYRETEESSDNRMSENVTEISERNGDFLQIWRRPSEGFIKINTDAAMSKQGSVLAFIARNEKGGTMHIHTFKSDVFIPEVEEMEAILRAMQAATHFGWNKVYRESDVAVVISSITTKDLKSIHSAAE
nr:uncharacterized protein LOC125422661 [Ziziphus jujuba var. spinosa]